MRPVAAITGAILVSVIIASAADLSSNKKTYDAALDDISLEHGMSLGLLSKNYNKSLEALANRVANQGNLARTRGVTTEIERFKKERAVRQKDMADSFVGLKKIQRSYALQVLKLDQIKARRVLALAMQYERSLAKLQTSLTKRRDIAAATAVESERATLKASGAVMSAKALLSANTKRAASRFAPDNARQIVGRAKATGKEKGLSATPSMRGKFRPSTRQQTLCLTFEKGVTDKIKKPSIQWTNVKTILDGRFGKGCALRGDGKLAIGPVKIPNKGTFALWVRVSKDADITEQMRIVDSNGLGLYIIGGKLHANFNDGKSTRIGITDPVIGDWMHLAVTWGEGEKRFFVDGELHSTTPYAGKPAAPVRVIHIGCRWTGTQMFFLGDLDEILMYDRCLSPDEIATVAAKVKE